MDAPNVILNKIYGYKVGNRILGNCYNIIFKDGFSYFQWEKTQEVEEVRRGNSHQFSLGQYFSLKANHYKLASFYVILQKLQSMTNHTIEPVYLNYGGAEKSCFEMTAEEFKLASESIVKRAKEKAFSKGLPIYFSENGITMAEYADGRIEIAKGSL